MLVFWPVKVNCLFVDWSLPFCNKLTWLLFWLLDWSFESILRANIFVLLLAGSNGLVVDGKLDWGLLCWLEDWFWVNMLDVFVLGGTFWLKIEVLVLVMGMRRSRYKEGKFEYIIKYKEREI